MKWKLFALALTEFAQAWYESLMDKSVDSWSDLCEDFTAPFTARKRQPTTMVVLNGVMQDKKETMCVFIDRFTKVVVAFGGAQMRA